MKESDKRDKDVNADPITEAPGSHPVGTGAGAAAGGAAGGAIGAAAGPVGAAVGLAAGAIIGGYAGKAAAEAVDPTREDAYWSRHYESRPYARGGRTYADYQSAYRTGWEGYDRYGRTGKRFNEAEPDLRAGYEKMRSRLDWNEARPAVRDAWLRLERNLEHLIDFSVVDNANHKIGTVETVWEDHTGQPAFLGIRTGWLGLGKMHVLPAHFAEVNEDSRKIRLPFGEDVLRNAPSFNDQSDIDPDGERSIWNYYEGHGFTATRLGATAAPAAETSPAAETPPTQRHRGTPERASIRLAEEQVTVGKREVEYGGVRLRKVIRTEVVQQPVELRREDIVVERVPAGEQDARPELFEEQEVYIPLRREEAVISKEAKVREEVRVDKKSETETQTVSETVRKGDIEIDDNWK